MTAATPGPVDSTDAIRLALRSWPEVESYLQGCKGVIIPLGSTEQHGPTGAIGTDALTAEAVALEVGRRTGVLVTPAQAFGMAEHHLGFAGTMSLQPATLLAVLHDLVLSLGRHGFERVFVINGHGGNIATAKAAFAQAHGTATTRNLPVAPQLRCRLANAHRRGVAEQGNHSGVPGQGDVRLDIPHNVFDGLARVRLDSLVVLVVPVVHLEFL